MKILHQNDHAILVRDNTLSSSNFPLYFLLKSEEVTIGRSADANFMLRDLKCSRLHLRLFFMDQTWYLTDHSSNGIRINWKRITSLLPIELKDGDEIGLLDDEIYKYHAKASPFLDILNKPIVAGFKRKNSETNGTDDDELSSKRITKSSQHLEDSDNILSPDILEGKIIENLELSTPNDVIAWRNKWIDLFNRLFEGNQRLPAPITLELLKDDCCLDFLLVNAMACTTASIEDIVSDSEAIEKEFYDIDETESFKDKREMRSCEWINMFEFFMKNSTGPYRLHPVDGLEIKNLIHLIINAQIHRIAIKKC